MLAVDLDSVPENSIAAVRALRPQDVPDARTCRVSARLRAELPARLLLEDGVWESNAAALAAIRDVLASNANVDAESAAALRDDEAVHDRFFRVERVSGAIAELFLDSVVRANAVLLEDLVLAPFRVSIDVLHRIDGAFKALQCRSLGVAFAGARRVGEWRPADAPRRSMERWIRGHQIFAVLTQGLIAAFLDLERARRSHDAATFDAAVEVAVAVLRGAGAALEFTGDLPPEDYRDLVRPSMNPPHVPETFSGLFSADHRFFVTQLRGMTASLQELAERRPADHARLASALGEVYDGHKFVCERLVGSSPSLMMMAGASASSGAEQIERFKQRRMKAFGARRPAPSGAAG